MTALASRNLCEFVRRVHVARHSKRRQEWRHVLTLEGSTMYKIIHTVTGIIVASTDDYGKACRIVDASAKLALIY